MVILLTFAGALAALPMLASAASSKFCDKGSFATLGRVGAKDRFRGQVTAPAGVFKVQGQYVEFSVDPATFGISNYAWTGRANTGDMVSNQYTTVFASKTPDHRGLVLTSPISLELRDEDLLISRTGPGISVKIQAKDCAQGGIFQMELSRGDNTSTRVVHKLADGAFHYDNPNFRANLGKFLGSNCSTETTGPPSQYCVRVTPRVNIGATGRPKLVLRDSAQVAARVQQAECGPDFTNALQLSDTRNYCGGMSIWDVASGGRMGMVTGEDATEVANPPTNCISNCQAENQVNGKLAVLGFPAAVPETSKLTPFTSKDGLDAPLAQF